jgi:hypothetical protein
MAKVETDGAPGDGSDSADSEIFDPITDYIFREVPPPAISKPAASTVTRSNRPVSDRLMQDVSQDTYKMIAERSRAKAQQEYATIVQECTFLNENREIVRTKTGTAADTPGGSWRKDPTQLTDEELEIEIQTVRYKIKSITQENLTLRQRKE